MSKAWVKVGVRELGAKNSLNFFIDFSGILWYCLSTDKKLDQNSTWKWSKIQFSWNWKSYNGDFSCPSLPTWARLLHWSTDVVVKIVVFVCTFWLLCVEVTSSVCALGQWVGTTLPCLPFEFFACFSELDFCNFMFLFFWDDLIKIRGS